MKIDKELIEKVAKNARLKLTEQEIKEFLPQLKEILESFSKLDEVKTDNVISSIQPIETKNVTREDSSRKPLDSDIALKNTTLKKDNYFKGPKAV